MRDVADKAEPITGADHFGAEFGETLMGDGTRLKIADGVWRVMHELHMADAPPMRLLEAFEFPLEKVEPLYIGDNRRLSRPVCGFEIGGIQRAAHAVTGDQLVHPSEAVEVVPVKLARRRRANCGKTAPGAACEHRPVRNVGEASHRQGTGAHRVCEIAARRRLRGDTGSAAMAMDIKRDGFAEDIERGRSILGSPRRCRRTAWPDLAGQHRPDRDQRCAQHAGLVRNDVAITATIHGVLLVLLIDETVGYSVHEIYRAMRARLHEPSGISREQNAA